MTTTYPVVVPNDLELWLLTTLRAELAARDEPVAAGVKVLPYLPDPIPAKVVWIRRDGGPRLDVVREAARFGVNVIATTEQDVIDLANLVRGLVWALQGYPQIHDVTEPLGPSPIADKSGRPWRFMSFELLSRLPSPAAVDGSGFAPLDGVSDPWRWVELWTGWAVAAYECSWTAGDMLPYVALVDRGAADIIGVSVGPIPATFAEFSSPYQRQSDPSNDATPNVNDTNATFDTTGSGMILVVQYEVGFTHTTCPDPTLDPTDPVFVGPLVIGPPVIF